MKTTSIYLSTVLGTAYAYAVLKNMLPPPRPKDLSMPDLTIHSAELDPGFVIPPGCDVKLIVRRDGHRVVGITVVARPRQATKNRTPEERFRSSADGILEDCIELGVIATEAAETVIHGATRIARWAAQRTGVWTLR